MQKLRLINERCGPLKDIRILDLSRLISGNFMSFQLAELGAEVIKVENPSTNGDPLRHFTNAGVPVNWKVLSRNKKSIALNLKTEEGRNIVLGLLRSSHVLIENFKPGGLEKLGLGTEILHQANPNAVIVRISGWGQSGPYSHKPGFGTLVEAFSGFAAKSGFPDSGPLLPNLGLADMIAGIIGAYAAMAAIREVEVNRGKGQVIDISLLESITSFLGADPAICQITGRPIPRLGNKVEISAPRNLYQAKDGEFIALSASMPSMVKRLFDAIGRPELIDDPKFSSNELRVKHSDELDEIIGGFIAERSFVDNLVFFEEHQITAGPLLDAMDVLKDPHVIERAVYLEARDPDVGTMPVPNVAPRFSETPGGIHSYAPDLGQHTNDILKEEGFVDAEISAMRQNGSVW